MVEALGPSAEETPAPGLLELVAAAADLCCKPLRHAVRFCGDPPTQVGDSCDCCVRIEARDGDGLRQPSADLELEIYRSGAALNMMLSRPHDEQAPMLWHGSHSLWMEPDSGLRCDRPQDAAPLEALCRRLSAVLAESDLTSTGRNHDSEP